MDKVKIYRDKLEMFPLISSTNDRRHISIKVCEKIILAKSFFHNFQIFQFFGIPFFYALNGPLLIDKAVQNLLFKIYYIFVILTKLHNIT